MIDFSNLMLEYTKCYKDKSRIYMIQNYLKTFDNTQRREVPYKLFPRQQDLCRALGSGTNVVCQKPRQAGITSTSGAFISCEMVLADKDSPQTVLVIGNTLDLAQQMLFTIRDYLMQFPLWRWGEEFMDLSDEIDNSDPSALIVINSALANGYMAFPHETIDRHPDFRIIAAANTWGKGADLQYVGRNALDAATLDRFDNIFFDYDRKLEECLYPSEEVLRFMWSFRDAVLKTKIPHVVSTRGIGKVYKKDQRGIPVNDILTSNVVKNLSQDDVNTVIGNMSDINASNKFYSGIKQLVLRR